MNRLIIGLAALALAATACSGGSSDTAQSPAPASTTSATAPAATSASTTTQPAATTSAATTAPTTVAPTTVAPTTEAPVGSTSLVAPTTEPVGYETYLSVSDDSGSITLDAPAEWSDIFGVAWERDGELIGPALTVAPDVEAFLNTWGTPGVFLAASSSLTITPTELLDSQFFGDSCTLNERAPYDDGVYVGEMDRWEGCGDEGSDFLVFVVQPTEGDFTVLGQILIVSDADRAAADEIIATFIVTDAPAP